MFRKDESPPLGMNGGDGVRGRMVKKVVFNLFLPPEEIKRGLYKEEFSVLICKNWCTGRVDLYIYSFLTWKYTFTN